MSRYAGTDPERKKTGPVVTGSRVIQVPDETEDWEQPEENEVPDRRGTTKLLTVIQIGVCGAVLVAAIALRVYGGDLYTSARSWYFEALNNSIVADADMENMKRTVLDLWSAISSSRMASSSAPQSGKEASSAPSGSQPQSSTAPQSGPQENGAASASQPSGSAVQSGSPPASQPQENQSAASPAQNAASPAGSKAP